LSGSGLPTPLLDVVFCLLIVFITATFLAIKGLNDPLESSELTLPAIDLADVKANEDEALGIMQQLLIVSLEWNCDHIRYFAGEDECSFSKLQQHIEKESPEELNLRVSDSVPFGKVMQVIDLARESGTSAISFAFNPREEERS